VCIVLCSAGRGDEIVKEGENQILCSYEKGKVLPSSTAHKGRERSGRRKKGARPCAVWALLKKKTKGFLTPIFREEMKRG